MHHTVQTFYILSNLFLILLNSCFRITVSCLLFVFRHSIREWIRGLYTCSVYTHALRITVSCLLFVFRHSIREWIRGLYICSVFVYLDNSYFIINLLLCIPCLSCPAIPFANGFAFITHAPFILTLFV